MMTHFLPPTPKHHTNWKFHRACRIKRKTTCTKCTGRFLWAGVDSNHRSLRRQIYSLLPLATREPTHIKYLQFFKTKTVLRRRLKVPPGFGPGNEGFADLCLTAWLWHQAKKRAVDETRTRDLHLGKVALYQLSYYRIRYAAGRNRTTDTEIFSLLLYLLSYRGIFTIRKGLEPSTSSVTGWHSNQLNYRTMWDGSNRARTCDPLLVRQMLSQLSYAPTFLLPSR